MRQWTENLSKCVALKCNTPGRAVHAHHLTPGRDTERERKGKSMRNVAVNLAANLCALKILS